ncbi:MAG: protein translocase subunit SecD, partial [Bdellovibrionales bacterium]|nr:protein translocase subunit SecD [Bdellovibrionales bacterium]
IAPSFIEGLPDWWPNRPLRLGLDLKGGSYLVLGVQTEEAIKSHLGAIAGSIRSELKREQVTIVRARQRGVRDVQVVLLDDRGLEKLDAYIQENYPFLVRGDLEKTGRRVTVTYTLTKEEAVEIEKNAVIQAIETIRNRVDQYGVAEPVIQRTGEDRVMVQLPDITNLDTVKETIGSVAKLEFRLVAGVDKPADETVSAKTREGATLRLEEDVLMTGDAIERANVEVNPQTNEIEVTLRLNGFGKQTFARITTENVNRQLAIVLDNVVQSFPVIREPITAGTAQISGGFTRDEAHRLAVVLRSGALPAPLTFEEERTVGATLGADSIRKGVNSMIAGAALVVVFVMIYYRKAGVLAVGCLVLNMLFLLALLSLLGATLTLPGIAGLVLTVGMAVDANVIIFERIREELRAGATARAAVDAGFMKAHWTILDANITTLVTGLILYNWGTGPIKGFAVTLCLGIITSMFSALFVSKVGFDVLKLKKSGGELSI